MMRAPLVSKPQPSPSAAPTVQRKCPRCGGAKPAGGACAGCAVKPILLQPKLAIGRANDPLEHEADRAADQVMAKRAPRDTTPWPVTLHRHGGGDGGGAEAPASVHRVLAQPGRALDTPVRRDMESGFGRDFSQVRVHDGSEAGRSAQEIGAQAYTVGTNIAFAPGHYAPASGSGRHLLAHELAHVVQQQSASVRRRIMRKIVVDDAGKNIPNPGGKGVVETNAQTAERYLQTLCPDGAISVAASGGVSIGTADFCPLSGPGPAGIPSPTKSALSSTPVGCECLCTMVLSPRTLTIDINDKVWPNTKGKVVTAPSPNNKNFFGAATASGKQTVMDPSLVLGHELCGHAYLAEKGLREDKAKRGKGGHQAAVKRENLIRGEHALEARGNFKDPYCGESFAKDKKTGKIKWSSFLKSCESWRKKNYGNKYDISDKIP